MGRSTCLTASSAPTVLGHVLRLFDPSSFIVKLKNKAFRVIQQYEQHIFYIFVKFTPKAIIYESNDMSCIY